MTSATQNLVSNTTHTHSIFFDYGVLFGRLLIAALFILAGIDKVTGFDGTVGYIESVGLPMATALAAFTAAFEIVAGLALVVGFQVRLAALGLAGFTVVASFLFHNYWAMPAEQAYIQQLMFMKNLAVAGGLLILAGAGAGAVSVDSKRNA
ncbi:MAG: DoxX family protein [Limnobacter sp.]|nr:DoxX family protein [Limnobacter sp.]